MAKTSQQLDFEEGRGNTPLGTNAGGFSNRDFYIPIKKPKKDLPERVDEIEPLFHTYGSWTGDIVQDMLVPPRGAPEGCYFDEEKAQKAVDFIETLKHYEGRFAGHRFRLMYWQERLVRYVFGWVDKDGLRLIRRVYLEIPRKNGKTMFAGALSILLAYEDDEGAALVVFAASDKEQSGDSYDKARSMVQSDYQLSQQSLVYGPAKKILIPNTHSEIRAVSSKSGKLYGLNIHGLVFDELMVQRDRNMWDALTSAQGAREQPLIIAITTAGFDKHSVAFEQHEYTSQVARGIVDDPTFLGVLYGLDEDEDWAVEESWRKASPSLGETVQVEYYREKCNEALAQPMAQNSFRTLLLCQWVGQSTRLINMPDWDSEEVPTVDLETLKGKVCYGGLDLSSTTDLTSFVLDFPNTPNDAYHTQLAWFWLPC